MTKRYQANSAFRRADATGETTQPFDLGELAAAIGNEANELFERCVELSDVCEQALRDWNPFATEDDETAYLDPGAELVPYDSLPDLRDLASRVAALGGRLAVVTALLQRERGTTSDDAL